MPKAKYFLKLKNASQISLINFRSFQKEWNFSMCFYGNVSAHHIFTKRILRDAEKAPLPAQRCALFIP
jgi:hypothetical protein